jgi:hypothetical protein
VSSVPEKADPKLENEPIILMQEQPKPVVKDPVVEPVVAKKPKKEPKQKDELQGVPLIEDLIKKVEKVESTLPIETSQLHQSAFLQLKKAIQKYKISINSAPAPVETKVNYPIVVETKPTPEPLEIEIKIEPTLPTKPVKPVKKQVPIEKIEKTEFSEKDSSVAITISEPK